MKTKLSFKQIFTAGLITSAAAATLNSILFFVFKSAGIIVDTVFVQPETPLTVVPVIFSSIVPTLIASVLFFTLEKYTSNGFRIFTIVSVILFVLTLAMPFAGIKDASMSYILALEAMHVVVFTSILYFFNSLVKRNA